ncbi:adenosylcobinamide-GDP ribazoletransferase [Geitlerinema sp. PCC 9228]|uniref:adenosylcobinamide-GDP ribazoletransferase n=1 Tax=Geitlerinema sp. PCC 9228 TaxID=111611 RepID=UPI0008F9C01D|nr:adenosylcobinamide-GDP ribazoletransferase [Geitlerinema sp. PCC 9228]
MWQQQMSTLAAAVAFYTCFPVPTTWTLEFRGMARLAPVVGILLGGWLGLLDGLLAALSVPILTRSALVVLAWLAATGGLHLDGAMDTADGLATPDPQRRLQVMSDSVTGAFGAMAAVAIVVLKIVALGDLADHRWVAIMAAAGWGRWGQLVAIARYRYLKPTGKGAMHKDTINSPMALLPGLVVLLALAGIFGWLAPANWLFALATVFGGSAIAILTGAWLNQKLGGHTGDTYGAIVEWTEALLLCLLTSLAA